MYFLSQFAKGTCFKGVYLSANLLKSTCSSRVLYAFWLKGGGGGGHFEVKEGHPIFTNNMIFFECSVIALFEAFYMLRDHNHVKMKF